MVLHNLLTSHSGDTRLKQALCIHPYSHIVSIMKNKNHNMYVIPCSPAYSYHLRSSHEIFTWRGKKDWRDVLRMRQRSAVWNRNPCSNLKVSVRPEFTHTALQLHLKFLVPCSELTLPLQPPGIKARPYMSLQDRVCQISPPISKSTTPFPYSSNNKNTFQASQLSKRCRPRTITERLDSTRTSPHDRSHFVSLPLHPISSLPASLWLTAPPRLMPYPAPSFTQPRLDLLASTSSSLPLDLAMPHLPLI
jgi:hypothetical protein